MGPRGLALVCSRAGAWPLILRGGAEPNPEAGTGPGGEERRASGPRAHFWTSHHAAALAARAGGRNTAGVPAPRETCAKWEAGHSGEALAQQDCSMHACPLPGFVLDCEPLLFPR